MALTIKCSSNGVLLFWPFVVISLLSHYYYCNLKKFTIKIYLGKVKKLIRNSRAMIDEEE